MRLEPPAADMPISPLYSDAPDDAAQNEADADVANVSEEDGSSETSDESSGTASVEAASSGASDADSGSTPVDLCPSVPARCLPHHEGPVFVLDVSSDGNHIVTLDPHGFALLWPLKKEGPAIPCRRSTSISEERVSCAAFSPDSTLLCTGDASGRLCVWAVDIPLVVCEFVTFAHIKWVCWNPEDNAVLAGTVDGIVWMWEGPGGACKAMQGSFTVCGDGRVMADGCRAATVYDDGSVCIWDLKQTYLLHDMSGPNRIHACRISSLDVSGELVATGADTVHVFHSGRKQVARTLPLIKPSTGPEDDEVGTLSFQSQQETLAAATYSGILALLDLPTLAEKRRYVHPSSISRVVWASPHMVLSSCGDGSVRAFDVRTESHDPVTRWQCSSSALLSLAMCHDGLSFVTSCCLGSCGVYRFEKAA